MVKQFEKEKIQIKKLNISQKARANKTVVTFFWILFGFLFLGGLAYATTISDSTSTYTGDIDLDGNDITNINSIDAVDWTDVSITESQISDLSHFNLTTNNSINNYILYVNSTNGGGSGTSDASWLINWTAYNDTWSSDTFVANYSTFLENNISTTNYITENNASVINYILEVNATNPGGAAETDPFWTANYSTFLENNVSLTNYIIEVNATNFQVNTGDASWLLNWTAYNDTWSSDTFVANYSTTAFIDTANVWTAGQNLTSQNITAIDCIIFDSGGKICSGV